MATSVELKACGGLAPYSWSKTGNVELDKTTGVLVTVTAQQNSYLTEDTPAYVDQAKFFYQTTASGPCGVGPHNGESTYTGTVGSEGANGYYCDSVLAGTAVGWTNGNPVILTWEDCGGGSHSDLTTDPSTFAGAVQGTCNYSVTAADGQIFTGTVPVTAGVFTELSLGGPIDLRTAGQLAGGCLPCNLFDPTGATVTLTDSVGASVTYAF